jgi:hypothetical protein
VRKEQKMKSYYKVCSLPHNTYYSNETRQLKFDLILAKSRVSEIEDLLVKQRDSVGPVPLHEDNAFTECVRLCVFDLLGLEVGIEKVPLVIQSVSHRMFNFNVNLKQLPSRQTVLRISDEAQYLTKAFYGEKMEDSDHFGIKKDGTQRQKVKMLDTSITA